MDKSFIILSSCDWGDMLQRPHHLARALAELGFEVHFIQTSFVTKEKTMNPSDDYYVSLCKKERRITDNVFIYQSVSVLDNNKFIYNNRINLIQNLINNYTNETVILSYFPSHITIINSLQGKFKLVYDCVDDHCDLEHSYWSSGSDIEDEQLMLDRADIVLTTSTALFLGKGFGRNNVLLSMNAVNEEDFGVDMLISEPEDLMGVPYPRVCYMGAVFSWFNEELFYKLVEANPDKAFVVIGPVACDMLSRDCKNLFKLGLKKHGELKSYLNHMDLGIIPFKDDIDLIINCNPIKMYEYLACNLPVVSTALPDLGLDKNYISIASSFGLFNQALNELIKIFPLEADVRDFISQNTWISRAKELTDLLESQDILKTCEIHKEEILKTRRTIWESVLKRHNLPVIKALYALTFAESNPKKFLKLAKESYQTSQTKFTLKIYIFALCLNNKVQEGIRVFINDDNIEDIFKAEVVWAHSLEQNALVKLKLISYTHNYVLAKKLIEEIQDLSLKNYERANYSSLIGKESSASMLYKSLIRVPILKQSPYFNKKLGSLLSRQWESYRESQTLNFKSSELIYQYLNKENKLETWSRNFSKKTVCNLCGGKKSLVVTERPDKQKVVRCNCCGLAFLEKMPNKKQLGKIYSEDYFNKVGIGGYDSNYNDLDYSFLFNPRLQWMENSLIDRNGKKLLDIGCSNGQFLELAKQFGWSGIGVEISCDQYKKALDKGIEVYNSELKKVKFEKDLFDCVTLWDVLEHYLSPVNELKEIYRILKPNGQLFLSTPNHLKGTIMGDNWFGYNASYEHLYYFEPDTLIRMLMEVGFKVNQCLSHEQGDWGITKVSNQGHILLVSARK